MALLFKQSHTPFIFIFEIKEIVKMVTLVTDFFGNFYYIRDSERVFI